MLLTLIIKCRVTYRSYRRLAKLEYTCERMHQNQIELCRCPVLEHYVQLSLAQTSRKGICTKIVSLHATECEKQHIKYQLKSLH